MKDSGQVSISGHVRKNTVMFTWTFDREEDAKAFFDDMRAMVGNGALHIDLGNTREVKPS